MKKHFTQFFVSVWALATFVLCHAEVGVTDVVVTPRWPWKGLVDITYSIAGGTTDTQVWVELSGHDNDLNQDIVMHAVTGEGVSSLVTPGGPYTVTWDVTKDQPEFHSSSFEISVKVHTEAPLYLVVDLSGGTNASKYPTRYMASGPDMSKDTCRTTELWLRRIPAGSFMMGSPSGETGRSANEDRHRVTLTQDFYIGVFECTQRQFELVMGSNPSIFKNATYYATRPVENVEYQQIRKNWYSEGIWWPDYGHTVGSSSFMGKLQTKTGLIFDLPTEAQWEYACRAGTTTALNSGKDATDSNMNEVGRYWGNGGLGSSDTCTTDNGTAKVGTYNPNAWGLYDMHGNVWEYCLDVYKYSLGTSAVTDPVGEFYSGNSKTYYRVYRGGSWGSGANHCRSAKRYDHLNETYPYRSYGFRCAVHLSGQ